MNDGPKLLEYYKNMLNFCGCKVTSDGHIKDEDGDQIIVDGLPLVLPTAEHIKTTVVPDNNGTSLRTIKVIFNPLRETNIRNESLALIQMRKLVMGKLNFTSLLVFDKLITLASRSDIQSSKMSDPFISDFIVKLSSAAKAIKLQELVDSKTTERYQKLMDNAIQYADTTFFIKLFIKPGGYVKGKKYLRTITVSYPLYNALLHPDGNNVYKAPLRKKDLSLFLTTLVTIIPDIGEHEEHIYGSNEKIAPAVHCITTVISLIGGRLNEIIEKLKFFGDEIEPLKLDWLDVDYDRLRGELEATPNQIKEAPVPTPINKQPIKQFTGNNNTNTPDPNVVMTSKGIDARSLLQQANRQYNNNNPFQSNGQGNGMGQPHNPFSGGGHFNNSQQSNPFQHNNFGQQLSPFNGGGVGSIFSGQNNGGFNPFGR